MVLVLPVGGMGHLDLLGAFHFWGLGFWCFWWLIGFMFIIKLDDIIFGDNMGRNVRNFWDFSWYFFIDLGHRVLQALTTREISHRYIYPNPQNPTTP